MILAGPNGAGQSTHARAIVEGLHGIDRFINPDTIASGLAGFLPSRADREARRSTLQAIAESIASRRNFAFETTLSGRRWPRLLESGSGRVETLLHYL